MASFLEKIELSEQCFTCVLYQANADEGLNNQCQHPQSGLVFTEHPLCVDCEAEGRYVAATDVDHIIPAREYAGSFYDPSNFASLCHAHHSAKTARTQALATHVSEANSWVTEHGGGTSCLYGSPTENRVSAARAWPRNGPWGGKEQTPIKMPIPAKISAFLPSFRWGLSDI